MDFLKFLRKFCCPVFILITTSPQLLKAQVDLTKADPERATAAVILEHPTNDPRILSRQHELVSSISCTGDGKQIFVAWYTGGKGEGPGNYVTLAVSLDYGRTWKNDQLVIYPKVPSTRFFDPVLWRDKNDKIWLFYAVSLNNRHWDLKEGVNALSIAWNGSEIIHGEPRLISYGVMMNKPVYVPQKDFVLFPVSVWQLGHDHSGESGYIKDGTFIRRFVYENKKDKINSTDEYSSFHVLPDSMRTYDEHQIVQTSEKGDFLGLIRTMKGIYYTRSADYGKTWTNLEPFTVTGPTTPSRFYIGRLKSGNLLLVLNNSKTRNNLTAFLSKDAGETWPYRLLIDSRANVSYPDVDQTNDGAIHLTHDRDRTGDKDIMYIRFTEDDIINKLEKNIIRTRINPK